MSHADQSPDLPVAPIITAADPSGFPYSVFHDRHPRLFEQIRAALPYGPERLDAIRRFEDETLHGTIGPLPADDLAEAGDAGDWERWGSEYIGADLLWTEAPFLWAESYFYRRLLSATGYFAGPFRGVDPFGPMKSASLASPDVDKLLAAEAVIAESTGDERDSALLKACLWGNRADLGFQLIAGEPVGVSLLVDDTAEIWAHLNEHPAGRVNLVADNAAEELLPDLLLLDHLLTTGRAMEVTLYLKPRPYYVSDAMMQDTVAALGRLVAAPGPAGEAGRRLWSYANEGRLTFSADAIFCAPLSFHALPPGIRDSIAESTLTIFKGDLNYRRLVGDRFWPATTPFATLTAYLGGPVAALRTFKSDVAAGLDAHTVAGLDATAPGWRVGGKHAVIQFSGD